VYGRHYDSLTGLKAGIADPGSIRRLARALALNSTADLRVDGPRVEFIRNPSEGALLLMAWRDLGIDYTQERADAGAPLFRRAFKKEAKFMSTIVAPETPEDCPIMYVLPSVFKLARPADCVWRV
jgi:magnesium-transporting ATPase (P-type)